MRMQKALVFLIIVLAIGLPSLSSCTPAPPAGNSGGESLHLQQILAQQTQSAIDAAFTATAEHELGDISTQVAIEHGTALALSAQLTQQAASLAATQIAATMLADQANSTATAQAQATGTARADLQATSTTEAQETSTAIAYTHGTSTAVVVQTQVARQEKAEARQQTWNTVWRILGAIILIAALIVLGILIFKFVPWVQVKHFGTQQWNGKPIPMIPDGKGGMMIGDIARSLGPGLVIDIKTGEVLSKGIFENPELQAQVVARAQAAELLLAANSGNGQLTRSQREAILRKAVHAGTEAVTSPYRILQPHDMPPPMLAQPGTVRILDAEWKEADDE
jgi:hypothetical protein